MREIDVIFLRNDPSQDAAERPWAAHVGAMFGRLAASAARSSSTIPSACRLRRTSSISRTFPRPCGPTTLISKSIEEIRAFIEEHREGVILKPCRVGRQERLQDRVAQGRQPQPDLRGGQRGRLSHRPELPARGQGRRHPLFRDERQPLMRDGKYAAFRRVPAKGEVRSNIHAGGTAEAGEDYRRHTGDRRDGTPETDPGRHVPGRPGYRRRQDPGDQRLHARRPPQYRGMHKIDFAEEIVDALENKVAIREAYGGPCPTARWRPSERIATDGVPTVGFHDIGRQRLNRKTSDDPLDPDRHRRRCPTAAENCA